MAQPTDNQKKYQEKKADILLQRAFNGLHSLDRIGNNGEHNSMNIVGFKELMKIRDNIANYMNKKHGNPNQ